MKYLAIFLIILVGVALLGLFYCEEKLCAKKTGLENVNSEDTFLACTLTNSELVERKTTLLPKIRPFVEDIRELEKGYLFQFPNDDDLLRELLEVIDLESRCCSFLEFDLRVEANQGPVWLQITGPKGAKDFIKENFISN